MGNYPGPRCVTVICHVLSSLVVASSSGGVGNGGGSGGGFVASF